MAATNTLLFASQNRNKQREALVLFADAPFKLVFPQDFSRLVDFDPEEFGNSFSEIARNKAQAYSERSGVSCIADDSGISIVALDNKPNIHSNRWFAGDDSARNQEVLRLLSEKSDRRAFYTTAASWYDPHTEQYVVIERELWGTIANEEHPLSGFAYDRIFIPEGFTDTFAELGEGVKNTCSQRVAAYKALKDCISQL